MSLKFANTAVLSHVGDHLQADGEDTGDDVSPWEFGAWSIEVEAVGRIGDVVGVRQCF